MLFNIIEQRLDDRAAHVHLRGVMADVIGFLRCKDLPDLGTANIDLIKHCLRVQNGQPPRRKVVQKDDFISPGKEQVHDVRTDKASSPRHKYFGHDDSFIDLRDVQRFGGQTEISTKPATLLYFDMENRG